MPYPGWVCVPASHYCPEEDVLLCPDFFSEGISGSEPTSMPWMSCCRMQSLLPSLNGMQTEGGFESAAFCFCGRWCAKFVHISSLFSKVYSRYHPSHSTCVILVTETIFCVDFCFVLCFESWECRQDLMSDNKLLSSLYCAKISLNSEGNNVNEMVL